ncbi:hypothetical protein EW026_g7057 [Hermanssonia centrifuga]|uniref:Uncharacterized protein n=1 Tax=Hermanssonia centrifuga TaxID=98765 RepID=A0A4S4K990_9APHY|nr:hypothetical protein EW026_g7057 [Hermanssonia centrifuga]
MGCSGRSALTLEEPSDTTKDRFISAYHVPEKALVRSSELFNSTVLELVKLIQAALSVCGMFDLSKEERNGLLCDVTCEGIQRWVTEIGESCANVEPMERVADPTVVAALFSTVLTVRNRLHAMGHFVPKDPFIDPLAFAKALTAFGSSKPHAHAHTLSLTHYSLQPPTLSHSVTSSPVQAVYLSQSLIETINAAYDKAKQSDTYKVHRVLINKLDDLATDLRTNPEPGGSTKGLFRWASNLVPTTDLGGFVKTISESSKDGAPSLRYLWTGRPGEVARKRKEKEMVWSEGEEKEREKELEKEIRGKEKDEKEREREKEKEVKSSEDEGDFLGGMPWSGRMQRKIESWAALGRTKKTSMDLGVRSRDGPNSPSRGPSEPASVVPSVVVSEPLDDDDILTSGQVSPASGAPTRSRLTFGNLPRAERSIGELSDYGRRVTEFNQKNPPAKPHIQGRIVSWSDPKTARDDVDSERGRTSKRRTLSPLKDSISDAQASKDSLFELEQETSRTTAKRLQALKKRRSFDDADALRGTRILPVDRMRIDAELCGQILVMRRREQHLANVLACLDALTSDLSATNSSLRQDYTSKLPEIEEVKRRAGLLQDIEAARVRADALTQETNALAYESAQFFVDDLWQMAALPRQKVFVMRERVFGTGRRLPQGVHGAHGRFNREQFTLDGRGRLVDTLGRTESEVEEENELPGLSRLVHEDEEDVVEHASLKPTWLLRMFNYWGSKWGTSGDVGKEKEKSQERQDDLRNRTTKSASMHESMTSATESRASLSRNKTIF